MLQVSSQKSVWQSAAGGGSNARVRPSVVSRRAHLDDEAAELQAADEAVVVGVHHVLVRDGDVVLRRHVVRQVVVHDEAQQPGFFLCMWGEGVSWVVGGEM